MYLQLHISKENGFPKINLSGITKINVTNINILEQKLMRLINSSENGISVDLTDIRFIDSQGFSMLLNLVTQSKNIDKHIFFTNIHPEVDELIQLLGISDCFTSIDSCQINT